MPDSLHSSLLTSRRTCSDKLEMRAGSFVCSSKALSLLDTLPNISHKRCSAGRSCYTHRIHQALMNKALPCVTLLRAGREHFSKHLAPGPWQSWLSLCFSLIIWEQQEQSAQPLILPSPYQALCSFLPKILQSSLHLPLGLLPSVLHHLQLAHCVLVVLQLSLSPPSSHFTPAPRSCSVMSSLTSRLVLAPAAAAVSLLFLPAP